MKSKTLMTMAIASTFGLSAAAFAGSSHEVMTPSSPNESYPSAVLDHGFHEHSMNTAMAPSQSIEQATGHDLALSDVSDWSASYDQMAEADVGDAYLVAFAPMDSYYVIGDDASADTIALIDDGTGSGTYYLVPIDTLAFYSDGGDAMTQ